MKKIKNLALTLICTAVLAACSGDDGKDGAAGLQGEQGVAGQDGVSNFVTVNDVIKTNAQHAYAVYADSLLAAKEMQMAMEQNPQTIAEQRASEVTEQIKGEIQGELDKVSQVGKTLRL